MELIIESLHDRSPFYFSFRYFVKFLFYTGGKVVIQNIREVFGKEVIHHSSCICRKEFRLFCSRHFIVTFIFNLIVFQCQHIKCTLFTVFISFFHIFALLNSRNRRSVCGRTTDTQLFQFTYKACFRIAWRALSETFSGNDRSIFQFLAFL